MIIESGPTGERKVRTTLLFLMFAVFSAWFAYDGFVGYPSKNRVELIEALPVEQRPKAANANVYPKVNGDNAELLRATIHGRGLKTPVFLSGTLAEKKKFIAEYFGGPPSFEEGNVFCYFGPALGMKFEVQAGGELEDSPMKTQHSETDINFQKYLSIGLAIFSLYLAYFMFRVRTTRAVLDDAGLKFNSTGPISWDAMKEMDTSRFAQKGWVDLIYDDSGQTRSLRLDEYHLAKYNEIMEALCERKGWPNPIVKPAEDEQPPVEPESV